MNQLYLLMANVIACIHLATALFLISMPIVVCRKNIPVWYIGCQAAVLGIAAIFHFTTGVCPLTFAENYLRVLGGAPGYQGNFLSHYSGLYFNVRLPDQLISSSIIFLAVLFVLTVIFRSGILYRKQAVS